MSDDWERVGVIGVDAGLCWIGDPCYLTPNSSSGNPLTDWGEFCNSLPSRLTAKQFNYAKGHPGLGVCISSGYGDGVYDVFIRKNEEGRVVEAKVVFITEKEEEIWETLTG